MRENKGRRHQSVNIRKRQSSGEIRRRRHQPDEEKKSMFLLEGLFSFRKLIISLIITLLLFISLALPMQTAQTLNDTLREKISYNMTNEEISLVIEFVQNASQNMPKIEISDYLK